MPAIADLAGSDSERQDHIVAVLVDAFADLIERDPRAFRGKFRKMAADPFAFYRGSAPLFYSDVDRLDDPWVDEATSRVWIQGDLHAENYGTYMDSAGVLVFDVNDFDEAYLGHYTWDLQRMAASLALLGFRKALSDASIARLIETYARAYVDTVRLFATTEVDVIKSWLSGISNIQQVGRNGLHRYNNSDHSMLTAMRAVDNVMTGSKHDLWAVNAESAYHEEHQEPEQPYKRVPSTQYEREPLHVSEEAAA